MRAVFVHKNCVLRDSHLDPASPFDGLRLTPATLEAMRLLATDERLLFIWGDCPSSDDGQHGMESLVKQIEAAGGRVDGLISCEHALDERCNCWGEFPGAFWVAASEFDLSLNECYLVADTAEEIESAYAAGMRPLIVLCDRSIGEILGNLPQHKDFPLAADLTTAVGYIAVEDDIRKELGHARVPAKAIPTDELMQAEALPTIKVTSPFAQGMRTNMQKSRLQLRDMGRMLTFFVLGALGLGLGIAYMLTHLYRQQPFPDFVYWITLQFIPRPLRGALFIAWGIGIIVLAVKSFYRSTTISVRMKKGKPSS
ncbi:MAG: hypothetical protein GX552_01765 [Chloroflexi bacterium]|jgi:hypothetical protein|nr:hypothetical protein [Chloroflexota bacterium]